MENIYLSSLKMLTVLIVIVVAILVLYRYSSKLRLNIKPRQHGLQKVDTVHLGYRKFVSILEVRGHILVIGVGDKEISLLADLKNEDGLT